jgi:pimeloyl-ACP methyl ester carboxylesterase
MSDDVLELINDNELNNVILLGHSMGGKVAMQFAVDHSQFLDKLIVVDIAPKYYPMHHQNVLEALQRVDFSTVINRKKVEEILSEYISDFGTRQFLLKNVYWKTETELAWRFNLKIIIEQIENVGEALESNVFCDIPTLFIRGENSNYILDEDIKAIQTVFPQADIATIVGAGHWVHAEKPKDFFDCVKRFLK